MNERNYRIGKSFPIYKQENTMILILYFLGVALFGFLFWIVRISSLKCGLEGPKSLTAATSYIIRNVYSPLTSAVNVHGEYQDVNGKAVFSDIASGIVQEFNCEIAFIIGERRPIQPTGSSRAYNIFLVDSYEGFR